MPSRVVTGLDRLLGEEQGRLVGRRVGLLCHAASVDCDLGHAADRLAAIEGCELVRILAPEHGVWGAAQDMISVDREPSLLDGVEIVSLYGAEASTLRPRREQIADLDLLVVDLQDIGARYYTYVWTMLYCLEACAEAGVPALVCDRPNPLGGVVVEGGGIEPSCRSFVGRASIPNRHGLTIGELAGYLAASDAWSLGEITVLELRNWRRDMWFDACGLPWVLPSPNMPTLETAVVYPGMCLVEGTELSEGRGTTRPFEFFGAPFIDPRRLADALERLALPGVRFRPIWFCPQFQKHAGQECGGVQLHVVDRDAFRSYLTGVAVVRTVRQLYPDAFRWRERAYEFVDDVPAFDLLAGSPRVREQIEGGAVLAEIAAGWREEEAVFRMDRMAHLLYR